MGRAIGIIILGILAVIVFAVSYSTVSGEGQYYFSGIGGVPASDSTSVAGYIVIAGKITDPANGQWLNNYTVVPYLNDKEITHPQARAISKTDKYAWSGEGVHDGCFVVYIPNRYELTPGHVFVNGKQEPVEMTFKNGGFGGRSDLYIWLGEVNPGEVFKLNIPDKQIEYAVAVMDFDNAHLDPAFIHSDTFLDENGKVKIQVNGEFEGGRGGGPEGFGVPGWKREFTPPRYMTYQEVWLLYVTQSETPPNLNTYNFPQEAMRVNPQLAQTGGFMANHTYYLPDVP